MILLDTDTFTLLSEGDARVAARFQAATEEVAITVITRAEVLVGRISFLLKAADGEEILRAQDWLRRSETALAPFPVVPFDAAAVSELERLKRIKGLPKIGHSDLLIAAITLANKATLVTRNRKHFQKVPGLQIENWAD
jgi:tRNA(fMet)-specific endonuclease VapC